MLFGYETLKTYEATTEKKKMKKKTRIIDINVKDHRGSTPLHFACF